MKCFCHEMHSVQKNMEQQIMRWIHWAQFKFNRWNSVWSVQACPSMKCRFHVDIQVYGALQHGRQELSLHFQHKLVVTGPNFSYGSFAWELRQCGAISPKAWHVPWLSGRNVTHPLLRQAAKIRSEWMVCNHIGEHTLISGQRPLMILRNRWSSTWIWRLSIFSYLSIIQYMGLYVLSSPNSLAMVESIYWFVLLSSSYRKYEILSIV